MAHGSPQSSRTAWMGSVPSSDISSDGGGETTDRLCLGVDYVCMELNTVRPSTTVVWGI